MDIQFSDSDNKEFAALFSLDPQLLEGIARAVNEQDCFFDRRELRESIEATGVSSPVSDYVAKHTIGVMAYCDQEDLVAEDVLLFAAREAGVAIDRDDLGSRANQNLRHLASIARAASVTRILKVTRLTADHQRVFAGCHAYIECRPVFDEKPSCEFGQVVTCSLRISFRTVDGGGEFFTTLDKFDLDVLVGELSRAKDKLAVLQGMNTSGNRYFVPGEET